MAKESVHQSLVAVDDDPELLRQISKSLGHRFIVLSTSDAAVAMEWVRSDQSVKMVMVGQVVHGDAGIKILENAMKIRPEVRRILITSYADIAMLVQGLHCGTIHRTLGKASLQRELASRGAAGQAPLAAQTGH
jgi:thioredoxin reductase (NADPH)